MINFDKDKASNGKLIEVNTKEEVNVVDSETLAKLDDAELHAYLLKQYFSQEKQNQFKKYFYSEIDKEELKSFEFISAGIFEDVSCMPWMFCNKAFSLSAQNLEEIFNIHYLKKIKGDGNCYYRAVLINYLEILIINSYEKEDFQIFFSLIKDIVLTQFPKENENRKNLSLIVFMALLEHLKLAIINKIDINYTGDNKSPSNIHKCFDILYRAYNKSDIIEKSLIMWIRLKLTDFLKANLDLEINGIKLVQLIPGFELEDDLTYDKKTVFKYIDNELNKMGEYVEGFPLYVTPLILKTEINIYHIDNYKPILVDMKYYKDISNYINPTTNFLYDISSNDFEHEINVLFRVPHYDTLYRRDFVDKVMQYYNNPNCFIIKGHLDVDEYNNYSNALAKKINEVNRSQNPLTQYLNGNKEAKGNIYDTGINKHIVIDLTKLERESDIVDLVDDENINGNFNNKKEVNNICVICFKEFESLIVFPCQESFCSKCFENKLNEYLNFKMKKKYDVRKIISIDDIIDIIKNEKKFKFVRCMNLGECPKELNLIEFRTVLERYYYLKDTGGREKLNGNKEKSKSIYCKTCECYTQLVKLQHDCQVCVDCLKRSLFKNNKKRNYKCFLCKKMNLTEEEFAQYNQN